MKNVLRVAILVATMAGWSCAKDYSDVVEDWKEDGWRVVDEFGERLSELKSIFRLRKVLGGKLMVG